MIKQDNEFEEIKKYKEKVIKQAIYDSSNIKKYNYCPHCGSKEFIMFGKYKGIQRYRCKNKKCQKTFSNTTNSVWKYLKCAPEKWMKFIELMAENRTLEECSHKLKITIATAFNWRHKIFHAIEDNYKPEIFKDIVNIRTYSVTKCYKGSRHKNFNYKDKLEKKINKMYGRIPRDVSVLFAGEGANIPLIRSSIEYKDIQENFKENVLNITEKNCYIHPQRFIEIELINEIADYNKKLPLKIRKKYGVKIKFKNIKDNIKEDEKNRNFIASLAVWLHNFRGIATKYINHYYNFFSLIYSEEVYDYMNLFFELLKRGSYTSINEMRINHKENY